MNRHLVFFGLGLLVWIGNSTPCNAETISAEVWVKTANLNRAGTSNKVYFSVLYVRGRSKIKKSTAELDNRKRKDFAVGRISKFNVNLTCPVNQVRGFELSVGDSDDAWACEGVKFQIVSNGRRSQPYELVIPKQQRWFSAAADDGGKKSPALQYRWWAIPQPTFSNKNRKLSD